MSTKTKITSHSGRYTASRGTWQSGEGTWRITSRDRGGYLSECLTEDQVHELFERLDPAPKAEEEIDLRKVVKAHTNDIRRVGHARPHLICRLLGHTPVFSDLKVDDEGYFRGTKTVWVTSCEDCARCKAKTDGPFKNYVI